MQLLQRGGIVHWPLHRHDLPVLVRVLLDTQTLSTLTGGDIEKFQLGQFESIGDSSVLAKIRSRVPDATQFEDVMLELSIAAWHLMSGDVAVLLEEPGLPDIRVQCPDHMGSLYVECKRLYSISDSRLRKQVQDANRQIRNAGSDCLGIVILDISSALGIHLADTDENPPAIDQVVQAVKAAITGEKNRAVARAIVVWDDYVIVGEPPAHTVVALRRHALPVDHSVSAPVPPNARTFAGATGLIGFVWDSSVH